MINATDVAIIKIEICLTEMKVKFVYEIPQSKWWQFEKICNL